MPISHGISLPQISTVIINYHIAERKSHKVTEIMKERQTKNSMKKISETASQQQAEWTQKEILIFRRKIYGRGIFRCVCVCARLCMHVSRCILIWTWPVDYCVRSYFATIRYFSFYIFEQQNSFVHFVTNGEAYCVCRVINGSSVASRCKSLPSVRPSAVSAMTTSLLLIQRTCCMSVYIFMSER